MNKTKEADEKRASNRNTCFFLEGVFWCKVGVISYFAEGGQLIEGFYWSGLRGKMWPVQGGKTD